MPRYCMVTEVQPGKLADYRRYHDNIYPEVAAGLRAAGITQLTIFMVPGTSRLVMYIETAGVDLANATGPGSNYRRNAKCKEWEELMDSDFHGGWTACEEIHASDREWNTALCLPGSEDAESVTEAQPPQPPQSAIQAAMDAANEMDAEVNDGGNPRAQAVLQRVKRTVNKRGEYGIRGLARYFKIMNDNGDGYLDREEFFYGMRDYGVQLTQRELNDLMSFFDRDGDGKISFDEFLRGMRGPLSDRRKYFIMQAFECLDRDGSGIVTLEEIESIYDASKHPDVIAGKKSTRQVLKEFMRQWEGDDGDDDGKITPAEFINYYKDVSASIDDDDYFELMMRNAWHISGGEGQMENTTCRRVLVLHTDGTQTVEEIKNDLFIEKDDEAGMIANLKKQGITDIKKIEMFGGLDDTGEAPASKQKPAAPANTRSNRNTSSSAFANGNNQNSGNYIGDRPSTRVKHAPGGKSSISFGGDAGSFRSRRTPKRSSKSTGGGASSIVFG